MTTKLMQLGLTKEQVDCVMTGGRARISVAAFDGKVLDVLVERVERSSREDADGPQYEVSSEFSIYSTASDTPQQTFLKFPLLELPTVMPKY